MEKLYKQTLSRIYINAAEERIMLSIAYGDNQSDILEMHFPEACYPSQGYEVTDGKNAVIKTGFGSLRVRNLMTILGDRTEPLTYWVMVGNRNVINRNEAKLARLSYGLHGQIADGLIFRVSTITTDAEAGYAKQRNFVNDLLNSMHAKDRVRLTGLTALKENKLTNKGINLKTLLCREQRFGSARCNFCNSIIFSLKCSADEMLTHGFACYSSYIVIILMISGAIACFLGALARYIPTPLDFAVWLILTGTFLINGVISLAFPSLKKLAWIFSIAGFLLLAGTLLTKTNRAKEQINLPGFIVALIVLLGGSVLISFTGQSSVMEIIGGTKRFYQLFGLMIAVAMLPIIDTSRNRLHTWLKFLFWVAFLQLPAALFELIVLVPKRVGMGDGVVPIDVVSGTFESSLEGGGSSSIMAIFLIIMLSYVLAIWKDKLINLKKLLIYVLLLGAPLFIGETKIVIVLLPLMFLIVFATEIRRRLLASMTAMVVGASLTVVLGWLYISMMSDGELTPEQRIEQTIEGNFGNVGYYDKFSLNRTTVITFWFEKHGLSNPVETVLGHGVGSSYSGAGNLIAGHLNQDYAFLGINLTGLSTLLWDVGLFGTFLFVYALIAGWRASSKLLRQLPEGVERSKLVALRVSLACNGFAFIYSDSILVNMSHEAIFALTMGYLAWLVREQNLKTKFSQNPKAQQA